ncbi:MAG: transposase [Pseudomonadales bacterium]|nr:transposase [Pseudomonadales bacterium]
MPRPGPRTTYKYTKEFKATAVRLSHIPGVQVGEVAESLAIHPSCCLVGEKKPARERS